MDACNIHSMGPEACRPHVVLNWRATPCVHPVCLRRITWFVQATGHSTCTLGLFLGIVFWFSLELFVKWPTFYLVEGNDTTVYWCTPLLVPKNPAWLKPVVALVCEHLYLNRYSHQHVVARVSLPMLRSLVCVDCSLLKQCAKEVSNVAPSYHLSMRSKMF